MKLPKITYHPILVLTILAPFLGSRSAQPASYPLHCTYTIVDFENWMFLVCWGSWTEIFSVGLVWAKLLECHWVRTLHTVWFSCDLSFSCSTSQMFLSRNQGSYASWKPLNFKSPFSRPSKSLKFSFVHFGPWILIEEHWLRIIVTITVLFITEGNSLISTHKGIFIKMDAIRKKAHYYQNIVIGYLEPVLRVINKVLEIWNCGPWKFLKSPWILQQKKCTNSAR